MPSYASESRDASGSLVRRTIEAASPSEAFQLLEADGLVPLKVEAARRGASLPARNDSRARSTTGGRIRTRDLLNFSRQLGSLVQAGVPILVALRSIGEQSSNEKLSGVLVELSNDIEQGATLSTALEAHPKTFPEVYTQTIRAGEETGSLDEMLQDLSAFLEAEIELRNSVRSALLYPAIVVGTLTLAIGALVVLVVPRFAEFYGKSQTQLPLPTRVLLFASEAFTDYFVVSLGVGFLLAWGARLALQRPATRLARDRFLLRVPILGRLIETASTIRVAQMLGLFTRAGVPLLQGLDTISAAIPNRVLRGRLQQASARIATGESLTASLTEADCFQPTTRQMLAAGELAGALEGACFNVAAGLRRELAYLTKNLSTAIEPLLTLVLAAVVLFVALAVFLPMWNMSGALG